MRTAITTLVATALMGILAMLSGEPFLFPSLGPTVLLVAAQPDAETSKPRVIVGAHAIGIACGYLGLLIAGLTDAPSAMDHGFDMPRIVATSLALAGTGFAMQRFRCVHVPAGATTLIVSLGVLHTPRQLAVMLLGVALLTAQSWTLVGLARRRRADS